MMVDCAKCGNPMDPLAPESCEVFGLCTPEEDRLDCAMGCSKFTPCSPECEAAYASPAPHLDRKTPGPCPACGACGTDPCII